MKNTHPTNLTVDDWVGALDRSDADIEARRIVSAETVMDGLRASLACMVAKQRETAIQRSTAPLS